MSTTSTNSNIVVVTDVPGLTVAPAATALTRLNYFDGKFLRAVDLKLEQDSQRRLVHLSNLAGGFGVVHGLSARLAGGDVLAVGAGMGIDAQGRLLLLPSDIEVSLTALIDASKALAKPARSPLRPPGPDVGRFLDCVLEGPTEADSTPQDNGLWLVTVAHAEFLCGTEDVHGKLCQEACVTSTDRPFRIEGVVLRARPLLLRSPYPTCGAVALDARHLRSRVASAYYADERKTTPSFISGAGLRADMWCAGATLAEGEVMLGVLCRQGQGNLWFDAWIARRERMDGPSRAYWAHRLAMRPWHEFLAQVLQFQCQLAELRGLPLVGGGAVPVDPCAADTRRLGDVRDTLTDLLKQWVGFDRPLLEHLKPSIERLERLQSQLREGDAPGAADDRSRALIDAGIVELPPAGYLPVDPSSKQSVDFQVRRLLGDGVDLRFCVIRPDDAARELEGAQHMDRISLLKGLDDPAARDVVDILVPDGRLLAFEDQAEGLVFRAKIGIDLPDQAAGRRLLQPLARGSISSVLERMSLFPTRLRGAARAAPRVGGGASFYLAVLRQDADLVGLDPSPLVRSRGPLDPHLIEFARRHGFVTDELDEDADPHPAPTSVLPILAVWCELVIDADPFAAVDTPIGFSAEMRAVYEADPFRYRLSGDFTIEQRAPLEGGEQLNGTLRGFELAETDNTNTPAEFKVTLYRRRDDTTGRVEVSLEPTEAKLDHHLILVWDGRGVRVTGASFHDFAQSEEREVLLAALHNLVRDEAVRDTRDPDHNAALQAVQRINNAIPRPSFAAESANKLFPTGGVVGPRQEIQAVRDWVLFHARHRRECAGLAPEKPVEPNRVYRLYTRKFGNADLLDAIGDELEGNRDDVDDHGFTEVGLVEFAAGVSSLRTSAQTLTLLWKPFATGYQLGWVGIASVGAAAAEGETIARGRALALESILEQSSPAITDQPTEVLAGVPDGLRAEDGVVIALLLQPLCHSLYWLSPSPEAAALVENHNWEELRTKDLIRHVSSVKFIDAKIIDDTDELYKKWLQVATNCPASGDMLSLYKKDDALVGTIESRDAQRQSIATALQVRDVQGKETEARGALPGDCSIWTLVRPKVTTIRFVALPLDISHPSGRSLEDLLQSGDVTALLETYPPFDKSVMFCFNSDVKLSGELKNFPAGHWERAFMFTRSDAHPDAKATAKQIAAGLKEFNLDPTFPREAKNPKNWDRGDIDLLVFIKPAPRVLY